MYSSFNIVHISYILLLPLFTIVIYFALRYKEHKTQTLILLLLLLVPLAFEFYDMFAYLKYGYFTIFANMPLFACDLNIFILALALIREPPKILLNKFILYYSTTGPVFTLIIPMIIDDTYLWYSNHVMGLFIPHIIYIIVSILYLKFNVSYIDYQKPYKVFLVMISMMTLVHLVNLFLIFKGINPDANYMFTINTDPLEFITQISMYLGAKNLVIRNYFVMALGYLILTLVLYFVHRLYTTLTKKYYDHSTGGIEL
ncbi:MAG: YwaF family protein [Christensenellaceae bacterium]|jgi:hypothetical protein|nr:YwaF family protein [Christensenellaceae bacterium]